MESYAFFCKTESARAVNLWACLARVICVHLRKESAVPTVAIAASVRASVHPEDASRSPKAIQSPFPDGVLQTLSSSYLLHVLLAISTECLCTSQILGNHTLKWESGQGFRYEVISFTMFMPCLIIAGMSAFSKIMATKQLLPADQVLGVEAWHDRLPTK